jgi:hypothetical protein
VWQIWGNSYGVHASARLNENSASKTMKLFLLNTYCFTCMTISAWVNYHCYSIEIANTFNKTL